ncbi:MAG: flagellin [Vampirovibrionales bacterium]|nr:flagellin [Vampirovibrionales bacterium]
MGMYIRSNQASLNVLRNLTSVGFDLNKSLERLASGYKINRASDGAASLAISEGLRSQIRGSQAAQTNIQQGISMLQTADGASQGIYESLQRIRELAVAAGNSGADFSALSAEFTQRVTEINQIANGTEYNDQVLLNGSLGATINLQVGPNAGDTINIASAFGNAQASTLGIALTAIGSIGDSATLIGQVDTAMGNLNSITAVIGSKTNQLESQSSNLSIAIENYSAAESSIRNTDIATETANMTRLQILQQSGVLALSQANMQSSLLLQLLNR